MKTRANNPVRRSLRHRGMALMLVVTVLAAAAILGYALLSANTLQAEVSSNLTHSAGAEYIAESGANVGMYYLQWPTLAPANWLTTTGYKLAATGVPLNDGSNANFDLKVTANPTINTYTIETTGWPETGSSFSHTVTAHVTVQRVQIPAAGVFGGNIAVPTRTTFSYGGTTSALAIQADGSIAATGGTVTGPMATSPLAANSYVVPTAANVNYYGVGMSGGTYLWTDGVTLGTPQQITANSLTASNLPPAAASNPAHVYYHNGNLTINGAMTLAGTLVVRGGTLTVSKSVTINPVSKYPALVCEQALALKAASTVLTINGVAFLGGGFNWTGTNTNSQLNINGALLMPAGEAIETSNKGTVIVTYTAANIDVPALTTFDQVGTGVQVNSWAQ